MIKNAWKTTHKKEVKEYSKKYRLKYHDEINIRTKQWRHDNAEKCKGYSKKYREANKEAVKISAAKRSLKRKESYMSTDQCLKKCSIIYKLIDSSMNMLARIIMLSRRTKSVLKQLRKVDPK